MLNGPPKALRRFVLVVFGTFVGLVAVEAALRIVYSKEAFERRYVPSTGPTTKAAHPFLPYVGESGLDYSMLLQVQGRPAPVRVRHNAYGLRTHELPSTKSAEDYFVVALGASTTWGFMADSNETTWPGILENLLAERYPNRNIKVFNLGTEGATTAFNVALLATIGIHIDPDLVLVYHGFNDYGPALAVDHKTDYSHHYQDFDPRTVRRGLGALLSPEVRSFRVLVFLASLIDRAAGINNLQAATELGHPASVSDLEFGLKRVLPNLKTIRAISEGAGAEVLFSTFQFRDGGEPSRQTMNRVLREYFEENDLDYVDQDALISDGDAALQIDDCHFTAAGRAAVARNFFDAIVEQRFVARSKP